MKKQIDKEKPKGKNEIEDLKFLIKRKKIQNSALQKIIENINKTDKK